MSDQAKPMMIGVAAGSAVTAFVALLINSAPTAMAAATPEPMRVRMGVEIDCSGFPHETARGKLLVISGHTSTDPELVTLRRGDFRREIGVKGKICTVDAVPLRDEDE